MILEIKTVEIFCAIKDGSYPLDIAWNTKATVNCISNKMNLFQEMGLIVRKKVGRKNIIYLTEKGRKVQKELKNVRKHIGKNTILLEVVGDGVKGRKIL